MIEPNNHRPKRLYTIESDDIGTWIMERGNKTPLAYIDDYATPDRIVSILRSAADIIEADQETEK